uniref:Uncharacterized protein n=1 Tax=Myripristis murdjan TaxID=586833 RepID=A0A667ZYQ9_9TELE
MIRSLGKLAFEELEKGNLIFYEADLAECGIDIRAASVYSGVFTQIFKEERGLYQDKVFCFVHLSVQEFLAAVHVFVTFINSGVNLLSEEQPTSQLKHLFQSAVDKALQSPNGHLDLFLRFLLGLSLQTNQTLLRDLLTQTGSGSQTNQETLQLSGCLLTQEGCASLASALSSNPSHLRELDLSYNHPGDSGEKLLSAGLEDPTWRLEALRYGDRHNGPYLAPDSLNPLFADLGFRKRRSPVKVAILCTSRYPQNTSATRYIMHRCVLGVTPVKPISVPGAIAFKGRMRYPKS